MFHFFRDQLSETASEIFDSLSFLATLIKCCQQDISLNLSPICIALTIALSFTGEMNLGYCSLTFAENAVFSLGHVRSLWHELVSAAVGSRRLPSCLPSFQLWMLCIYKGQLHLELRQVCLFCIKAYILNYFLR